MKPLKVDELKEELEARGEATSAVGQQGMPAPVAVHARRGDLVREQYLDGANSAMRYGFIWRGRTGPGRGRESRE